MDKPFADAKADAVVVVAVFKVARSQRFKCVIYVGQRQTQTHSHPHTQTQTLADTHPHTSWPSSKDPNINFGPFSTLEMLARHTHSHSRSHICI